MEEKLKKIKDFIVDFPYLITYDGRLNINGIPIQISKNAYYGHGGYPAGYYIYIIFDGFNKFPLSESEYQILIKHQDIAIRKYLENWADKFIEEYKIK